MTTEQPETLLQMAEACESLTKLMLVIPGIDTGAWAKTLREANERLEAQGREVAELEKQHIERLLRIEQKVDLLIAERDNLLERLAASQKEELDLRAELAAIRAQQKNAVPQAWTNLLAYVLQDDLHNRLTPRVSDIAYTAFNLAKQPNTEDGGASDWFNDTKPTVAKMIEKLRKDLIEEFAAIRAQEPVAWQGRWLDMSDASEGWSEWRNVDTIDLPRWQARVAKHPNGFELRALSALSQSQAAPARVVPDGYVLVPNTPSNEMTSAMADALEDPENERSSWDLAENMYRAMLAAAPQQKGGAA